MYPGTEYVRFSEHLCARTQNCKVHSNHTGGKHEDSSFPHPDVWPSPGFYVDRIAGGHLYHRRIGVFDYTGRPERPRSGSPNPVHQQLEQPRHSCAKLRLLTGWPIAPADNPGRHCQRPQRSDRSIWRDVAADSTPPPRSGRPRSSAAGKRLFHSAGGVEDLGFCLPRRFRP